MLTMLTLLTRDENTPKINLYLQLPGRSPRPKFGFLQYRVTILLYRKIAEIRPPFSQTSKPPETHKTTMAEDRRLH